MLDNHTFLESFGRGVYHYESGGDMEDMMSIISVLLYAGSRWLNVDFNNSKNFSSDELLAYSRESHPFWDEVCKRYTHSISNPTTRSDPVAVDFFQIGRRGAKYGPLGELIPMQDPPGSGYFDCSIAQTMESNI